MSYLHERQREGCPYSRGSVEREIWLEGWNQTANAERKACLRFD
jgi:ribosome modulation factor